MWQVGTHLLRSLDTGELVGVHGTPALERIAIIDPVSGSWRDLECDLTNFAHLSIHDDCVYAIGGAPKTLAALVELSVSNQKTPVVITEVLASIDQDFFQLLKHMNFQVKMDAQFMHSFHLQLIQTMQAMSCHQ
jgi:hypothetical protein